MTIAGKTIASSLGALITGQSLPTSLRVGFSMAQIGEFSFIIVGLGITMGVVNNNLFPIIVAVSALTTFTTPYLIRLSGQLVTTMDRKLPVRVKINLNNYSTWVYRALADKSDSVYYRRILVRFLINAIVVAVIFTTIDELLSPYLEQIITHEWLSEFLSWLTALVLSSPFIWGMLFTVKVSTDLDPNQHKASFYVLRAIVWAMVAAEVIFLSVAYFYTWIVIVCLLLVALTFSTFFYTRLGKFYFWFETNFLANIQQSEEGEDQFKQLAPWDSHLIALIVATDSSAINKTIEELQVRQEFTINIVAIQRQKNLFMAPGGTETLQANDKLIVLGKDEDIDHFKKIITDPDVLLHTRDVLSDFMLKAILLDANSPLIGKTIRESQIRTQAHALVVGLERYGQEILNPDPAIVLQSGDLLLLVGAAQYLKKISAIK